MGHSRDCVLGPDGHCIDCCIDGCYLSAGVAQPASQEGRAAFLGPDDVRAWREEAEHRVLRPPLVRPPDLRRGSQEENRALREGGHAVVPGAVPQDIIQDIIQDIHWVSSSAMLDPGRAEISNPGPGELTADQQFISDLISAGLDQGLFVVETNPPGSAAEPDSSSWPAHPLRTWQEQLALYQEQEHHLLHPAIAPGVTADPALDPQVPLTHDEILLSLHDERREGDSGAAAMLTHEEHDIVFGLRVPLWRCSYRLTAGDRPCAAEIKWGGQAHFLESSGWYHVQASRWQSHAAVAASDADPDKPAPG